MNIIVAMIVGFMGYLIGRVGHCYLNVWMGNPNWLPHHWIYGVLIMVVGTFCIDEIGLSVWTFSFGLGVFISDFRDFALMKFFEPDDEGKKDFWNID